MNDCKVMRKSKKKKKKKKKEGKEEGKEGGVWDREQEKKSDELRGCVAVRWERSTDESRKGEGNKALSLVRWEGKKEGKGREGSAKGRRKRNASRQLKAGHKEEDKSRQSTSVEHN
jgi:hypothetical protein